MAPSRDRKHCPLLPGCPVDGLCARAPPCGMTLPCHGPAPGGKELLDIRHLPEALTPWRELPWLHGWSYLLSLLTWCQSNPRDGVKGDTTGVSHLPLSCWSPSSVPPGATSLLECPHSFQCRRGPLDLGSPSLQNSLGRSSPCPYPW